MSTEPNSKSEVLESWEEIDEVQLDSTVNRLKDETMKSRIEEERLSAPGGVSLVQTIQKPVVILRRPQAATTNGTSSTQEGQKPKTQIKSLMQRQQEYAEARMRILGSMPDEEDTVTVTSTPPPTINMNGTTRNPHGPGSGNGFLLRR